MKNAIFRCTIAAAILFLPWLGLKDFYTRGEAREALVAQNMVATSNYILPKGYDDTVPSKPPVLHWLIAASSKIMGGDVDAFQSRFPSALASVLFVAFFASFLMSRDRSLSIAPFILLTSVEWFRASTAARVDCLLAVFFSAALLLLYRWFGRSFVGAPWGAIFFLGLAALTKGPVGVLLPLFVFTVFLFVERNSLPSTIRALLVTAVPALALASIWYILAFGQGGDQFWHKFYYENIARFTSTMDDEPHKHSIFYLYGVFLLGLMPWTIPLLIQAGAEWKGLSRQALQRFWNRSSFLRFCIIWSLSLLVFFSIPSSKRSVYLLPAYPACAVLIAAAFSQIHGTAAKWIQRAGIILAVGGICAVVTAVFSPQVVSKSMEFSTVAASIALVVLVCALVTSLRFDDKRPHTALVHFGFCVWAVLVSSQCFFEPAVANAVSYRSFADETRKLVEREHTLYSYEDEFYGISFYLKKPFRTVSMNEGDAVPTGLIYLYEDNLGALKARLREDQRIDVLIRSMKDVVKTDRKVLLVSVQRVVHE